MQVFRTLPTLLQVTKRRIFGSISISMDPNRQQYGQQPLPAPQQPVYGDNAGTPQQTYESLPPPTPGGHASGHNPYDFIINPNTPKKRSLVPGNNSFLVKLAIFLVGFVLLLVVLGVILSAVFSGSDVKPELTETAQTQQEILRIAGSSAAANRQSSKDVAASIQLTILSDQQSLLKYLATRGAKPNAKTLALGKDSKTDQLLESAKATNTYDAMYLQTLSDDLMAYRAQIQAIYKKTTSKTLKTNLTQYFTNAVMLSEQVKNAQENGS